MKLPYRHRTVKQGEGTSEPDQQVLTIHSSFHRCTEFMKYQLAGSRDFGVYRRLITVVYLLQVVAHTRTLSITTTLQEDNNEILPEQLRTLWYCTLRATSHPTNASDELFCPAHFDGYSCWNPTAAGQTAEVPCPSFVPGSDVMKLAVRKCLPDGIWALSPVTGRYEADYSACSFNKYYKLDEEMLLRLLEILHQMPGSPYDVPQYARAFDECIRTTLSKPPKNDGGTLYCPKTFDLWGCWNDTPAGKIAYIPCPTFVPGFSHNSFAFKQCTENGTWFRHPVTNRIWSNYTTCVDIEDMSFRLLIVKLHIAGYSVSVIILLISLGIFFYFKSLHCTRIAVHKNLFCSFVINNVMWIAWYTVLQKAHILLTNHWACQAFHVLVQHFMVCNYFWMFCEGLYLYALIVAVFIKKEKVLKLLYILGWGTPIIITVSYAVSRGLNEEETKLCWIDKSYYEWIILGPIVVILLVNGVFLVHIVIIIAKRKLSNSEVTSTIKKSVRATLILIPLLGTHFLLFPVVPESGTLEEHIYQIASAIFTSFQGTFVALAFCIFDKEVLSVLRRHKILPITRKKSLGISSSRRTVTTTA